jgi:ribonuclease Y
MSSRGSEERTSRVSPIFVNLILSAAVAVLVAAAIIVAWTASRKRAAADTIGRAEEQAARIVKDAERDADARKKEALLEAKEKAHQIVVDVERQAHQRQQEASALDQTLTRREAALLERQGTVNRLEKELTGRHTALAERERTAEAASQRYQQLVATQQRELERLAGLTA